MWLGTVAMILLAFRGIWPFWLAVGLGNGVTVTAYGFLWCGFRVFFGKNPKLGLALAGMLIWLGCLAGFDWVRSDVNIRIVLMATLLVAYALPIVVECWKGWKNEGLPTSLACGLFFITHAVTYAVRIPLAFIHPAEDYLGTAWSPWFAFLTLEAFVHVLFTTISIIVLVKERAEVRFRVAAETDSLTGAPNRSHFVHSVERYLANKAEPFVFALMDLDNFKLINDRYGHLAGDQVLKAFAEILKTHLPRSSTFGRIGGEEFAMLICGLEENEAIGVLEAVRVATESLEPGTLAGVPRVTVSIGAVTSAGGLRAFDNLMAAADVALYAAKGQGRNQLCLYDPVHALKTIGEAETYTGTASQQPSIIPERLAATI